MSSLWVDKTIKPGDLVEVEAWAEKYIDIDNTERENNLAIVMKIESDSVFNDRDSIVHLLFLGASTGAVAMLSRLNRVNPPSS